MGRRCKATFDSGGGGGIAVGDLYGICQAAVVYITQSMALDFGRFNIRVNAIAPGVTMSEATRKVVSEPFVEALVGQSALGRRSRREN